MTGHVGEDVLEHQHVRGQHPSRHGGEAAHHDGEELGRCCLLDEGLDEQRRFGLAQEDVARGRERLRPRGAEGALHDPRDALHHDLHDAEVVEHGHEGREEDDRRQHGEGEEGPRVGHESHARVELSRGQGPAHRQVTVHQVAEDKAGAHEGEAQEAVDDVAHLLEEVAARRGLQHQHAEHGLEAEARAHQPPGDLPPVVAHGVGDADHDGDAEKADGAIGQAQVEPALLECREWVLQGEPPSSFSRARPGSWVCVPALRGRGSRPA